MTDTTPAPSIAEQMRTLATAQAARAAARREPKLSDDRSRYSVGVGRARLEVPELAPEIVSAIPELAEARAAWQSANEVGFALYADERAAQAVLETLVRPPGLTRKPGVALPEFEAARDARDAARRAVEAQERRALAALKAYDDLCHGAEHREAVQAAATKLAASAHEEAVAAWSALRSALTIRDRAHRAAGSPGRAWESRYLGRPEYDRQIADGYYAARVDGFDLDAVKEA